MTRVVLASASSARLRVLRQAGIDPLVVVSGVDEDAVAAQLTPQATPSDVTMALAVAKAEAVVATLAPEIAGDCVVIGCDSLLSHRDELIGKPHSADAVRRQWQLMAGSEGELYTGHCVLRLRDGAVSFQRSQSSFATVIFGSPSAAELELYIRSGEPLKVAGAFTLDGLGGWFVESVRGDPSGVIGISLPLTRRMLQDAGLSVTDLWEVDLPR